MTRVVRINIVVDNAGAIRAMEETATAADKVGAAGRKTESLGRTMTMMAAPVIALGAYSVKTAADFQSSMERIRTQAGGSQREVAYLSRGIQNMAGSVGTTAQTLAAGAYHIESQGIRGARALYALRIAAEGAKIGGADLEDVTNGLGAAIASGISGVQNYRSAMGALNATVGAGDMRMQDLADALSTGLLAPLSGFGLRLTDVSAALAVFGDNNIRGAEAGTKLLSAIRIMAAPSNAAAKALAAIGISQTQLADDMRSRGLVAAFSDLKQHLQEFGGTPSQQGVILTRAFGGRQSTGVQVLLRQLDRLQRKVGVVTRGATGFGRAWRATTDTTAFRAAQAWAQINAALITLGTTLMPIVNRILPKFTHAIVSIVHFLSALPKPVKDVIAAFAVFLAIGGPLLIFAGKLMKAVKEFTFVLDGLGATLDFLAANPVILIIAAMVAVGVAVYECYEHFRAFRSMVDAVFRWIKGAVGAVVAFFKKHWELLGLVLGGPFLALGLLVAKHFGTVKHIIGDVVDWVAGKFEWLWHKIKGVIDAIGGLPGKVLHAAGHLASGALHTATFGLFNEGGLVRHFAPGGFVSGPGGIDQVPARLTAGEFVLRREVVNAVGVSNLNALNSTGRLAGGPSEVVIPVVLKVGERVLAQAVVRHQLQMAARA